MASNEKDSPISLLETLSEIDGNLEYFAVAKDGTTYKCTPAQLKDFVLKGETPVVRIPLAVLNLNNSSSSEDILNAFGGKETFIALCEKIYGRDVVCVCQGFTSDDENMKTGYVTQAISCKHIDAENAILMFLINIDSVSHRLMINCVDGMASFSKTTVDDASVILLPDDVNSIEQTYSSKQIFDAFGGKDAYNGYVSKITQKSVVKIGDALYAVSQVLGSSYTDENNSQLVVQTIAMNVIKYIQVTVTGGTAKAIVGKWDVVDAAPTDGKAYGRKNGNWAEVPEHLNLTSENLNDINGAGFATQKSIADYTSPENNYPINENGALIFANANYGHSNQIYGSYLTNRWFARGGGNQHGVRTNWKEFAFTDDVLTKTNTSSFTPTGDYQPATKKYVDDKHIILTITDEAHIQLISNQEVKAGEAESKINLVFGSIDNFKNIIQRLLSDSILFLKITEKEIFKVSTSHTYCNPDKGAYELSFIYTYTSIADANNINLVTKRIFIALKSSATNFFVVKDILVSDNLTTITKKTAAEYEAIGSKDANTAYCVTD